MSNLIERLMNFHERRQELTSGDQMSIYKEAAERIEELEQENDRLLERCKPNSVVTFGDVTHYVNNKVKAYIEELEAQVEWQPIETAPKDGTRIIAFGMTRTVNKIMFKDDPRPFVDTIRYEHGLWQGGWVNALPEPTHWMPLPEPPEEQSHE